MAQKQYIISKIQTGTTVYLCENKGESFMWTNAITLAKVFTGCSETRKVRSGSNQPGAARWKILDYKPSKK